MLPRKRLVVNSRKAVRSRKNEKVCEARKKSNVGLHLRDTQREMGSMEIGLQEWASRVFRKCICTSLSMLVIRSMRATTEEQRDLFPSEQDLQDVAEMQAVLSCLDIISFRPQHHDFTISNYLWLSENCSSI